MNGADSSRSGAIYRSLQRPERIRRMTAAYSSDSKDEFKNSAPMPLARRAPTWSAIRDMSGDTTRARPGQHQCGDLVAQALPAARGHDAEAVPAG